MTIKKISYIAALALILGGGLSALADVNVTTQPTSLITTPKLVMASSAPVGLFSFSLSQTAGETLSSVTVQINNTGTSTSTGSDFGALTVYKDTGDSTFNSGTDALAGNQTTVNVGVPTTITLTSNNSLNGTFFVALSTGASWSSASATPDSITVTIPTSGIVASNGTVTTTAVTTDTITADTVGPELLTAVAKNTGGNNGIQAGDSLELTFSQNTTKPSFTATTLASTFTVNNGHSLLDGAGNINGAVWNTDGNLLTITFSAGTSLPTIQVGDTVTVAGSIVHDAIGNLSTGSRTVTGSFNNADTSGPVLLSAVAKDTSNSTGKKAGDSIALTFGEATNKPSISEANINSVLALNNSHSWLDGAGHIGSALWNTDGTILTITISDSTSLPTIEIGDTITINGAVIKDVAQNNATGAQVIGGKFTTPKSEDDDGDDDHDNSDKKGHGRICDNGLIRGKWYQVTGSDTIYHASGCKLKEFKKIITLPTLNGIDVKVKQGKNN